MLFYLIFPIFFTSVSFRGLPSASASPLVRIKNIISIKIKLYVLLLLSIPNDIKYTYSNPQWVKRLLMGRLYIFYIKYYHVANFFQEPSWNLKSPKIWPNRLFFKNLDYLWVFLMSFSCYFGYFYLFLALPSASTSPLVGLKNIISIKIKLYVLILLSIPNDIKYTYSNL